MLARRAGATCPPAAARIKQLGADLIDAIEELPENGNTETRRLKDIGAARAEGRDPLGGEGGDVGDVMAKQTSDRRWSRRRQFKLWLYRVAWSCFWAFLLVCLAMFAAFEWMPAIVWRTALGAGVGIGTLFWVIEDR